MQVDYTNPASKKQIKDIKTFTPAEFDYSELLGEGAFGRVRKCCQIKRTSASSGDSTESGDGQTMGMLNSVSRVGSRLVPKTNKVYAVKLQSKYELIKGKQEEHVFNEMKIMNEISHPFILDLRGVAQDNRILYMYIDFMPNGDLMKVINRFIQLDVYQAKFYIGQVVLALEYLHSKGMIYRDLKPENILVQPDGFIKLADFGFVKQLQGNQRTYTFCGTPEYIAPEIIMNKGYNQPVDWYALGILMYEMMYGRPPFMHSDTYKLFEMTLKQKIRFPRDFDPEAKSLIKRLTKHDLSERYGNLHGGVSDIKNHRLFKGFNWNELALKKMRAAYIPDGPKQTKDEHTKYGHFEEYLDEKRFPPIKVDKDAFFDFF